MKPESVEFARRNLELWRALRRQIEPIKVEVIGDGLEDYRFTPTPEQEASIARSRAKIRRALGNESAA